MPTRLIIGLEFTVKAVKAETAIHIKMDAANYPDIVAHQAEHKKFLAELGRLRAALAAGESVYEQLCDFYRTWLTNHIMVSDKKLSKFVYGLGG